jgi:hypothetical protein
MGGVTRVPEGWLVDQVADLFGVGTKVVAREHELSPQPRPPEMQVAEPRLHPRQWRLLEQRPSPQFHHPVLEPGPREREVQALPRQRGRLGSPAAPQQG